MHKQPEEAIDRYGNRIDPTSIIHNLVCDADFSVFSRHTKKDTMGSSQRHKSLN